jgi:transposase-like protein
MNESTQNDSKIVAINENVVKNHLNAIVRSTVEETLNGLLDAEADRLCQAQKHERSPERVDSRAGYYERGLQTQAGAVKLKVPKLRQGTFETAIIERYKRREASVEESLIEMYLAGVSVRRIEDITEALWGTKVSPSTISELNKKVYAHIETWRNRDITGKFPYVYLDGIVLKRTWSGEVRNVSLLVAIGVGEDGYRHVLGIAEGAKEDKAGWSSFLAHLKQRGLTGIQLIVSDACLGLVESMADYYPEAKWQRCVVHFYRNVFSVVPSTKVRDVADMLKAIHAQEDKPAAQHKAEQIIAKLLEMKLPKAAEKIRESIEQTFAYYGFPKSHWIRLRTNNPLERLMREIRRRTRVVGAFPDGQSALMLAAARLRHVSSTQWGTKRYMNMDLLKQMDVQHQTA